MRPVLLLLLLQHVFGMRAGLEAKGRSQLSPGAVSGLAPEHVHLYTPEEYQKMIADYSADWTKHGVDVEVFDSVDELKRQSTAPWQWPGDKAVSTTSEQDTPRCTDGHCTSVRMEELIPYLKEAPYLYHGGDIKTEHFADGIDFEKAADKIIGPAFFTTHNVYYALLYGGKAVFSWGDHSKGNETTYRPAVTLEVGKLDQCVGLVPDLAFLHRSAAMASSDRSNFVQSQCGSEKCSFVAVNWNKDGQPGSGPIPYEIRLLPGSIERCGLKIQKVLLVKGILMDPFFSEFAVSDNIMAAWDTFYELTDQSTATPA